MSNDNKIFEVVDSPGRTYRPCKHCGSRKFYDIIQSEVANNIAELETRCASCDTTHLYWAYGSYEPIYGHPTFEEDEEAYKDYLRKRIDLWGIKRDRGDEEQKVLINKVRAGRMSKTWVRKGARRAEASGGILGPSPYPPPP